MLAALQNAIKGFGLCQLVLHGIGWYYSLSLVMSKGVGQCCRDLARLFLSLVESAGAVGDYHGWCCE